MYENSFGFSENPFNLTSDPRFLHLTRRAKETLHQLTHGILNRKGLILLLGEVGTGKTTLLYAALRRLEASSAAEAKMATAIIVNPTLTREELLEAILDDFEVPCAATSSKPQRLAALLEMLLDVRDKGGTAVLIVDEAHLLTTELLEEIRLLLSVQTIHENLLQVVLSGQPEIEEKLRQIGLRDLLQHITARCKTAPLTLKDTDDYIHHRLRIAGAKSESIFPREAVKAVHLHSHGIPRVINLLCDHALVSADLNRVQHVSTPLIEEAAAKLHFHDIKPLAQRLHSSHSSNTATAELTASRSTLNREEARTDTTAPKTVIPEGPQTSRRPASAVGSPNRVSPTQSPMSIRIWSQSLDRWWSSNFAFAKDWMVLSAMGLAGAVLLTIAQGMSPLAPWQHFARAPLGFSGLLLIDVSLGFGAFLFVYECQTRSRNWIPLSAIKCLLKARSDGKLARQIRCLREWLGAPWSKDRKLVRQIRHLREWLQAPWSRAYEPLDRRAQTRHPVG